MQKSHKFFISRAEADKEEFQVQTDWAFRLETGTQTGQEVAVDSALQVGGSGAIRARSRPWSLMMDLLDQLMNRNT
jgi:hypothetical protein